MNWYLEVWRKFNVFSGRARRTEYWMFVLVNVVVSFVLGFVETMVGLPGIFSGLYAFVVLLPAIAVSIRRLHDTGRPGLWVLAMFVPLLNLVVLYFMVIEGDSGSNQYGANPKAA